MASKYNDILYLPHPVSAKHPPMNTADRAAQFAAFAAVTGFDGTIRETARLTQGETELDEDSKMVLDRKFLWLQENVHCQPRMRLVCFIPDKRKQGGAYVSMEGKVKKLDVFHRCLEFTDGKTVDLSGVVDMDSPEFENMDF